MALTVAKAMDLRREYLPVDESDPRKGLSSTIIEAKLEKYSVVHNDVRMYY